MKRMKIPGWGQCASVRGGHGDVPAHSSPSRARWLGMRLLVLTVLLSMMGAHGAWAQNTLVQTKVSTMGSWTFGTTNDNTHYTWTETRTSFALQGTQSYPVDYRTGSGGWISYSFPNGYGNQPSDGGVLVMKTNGPGYLEVQAYTGKIPTFGIEGGTNYGNSMEARKLTISNGNDLQEGDLLMFNVKSANTNDNKLFVFKGSNQNSGGDYTNPNTNSSYGATWLGSDETQSIQYPVTQEILNSIKGGNAYVWGQNLTVNSVSIYRGDVCIWYEPNGSTTKALKYPDASSTDRPIVTHKFDDDAARTIYISATPKYKVLSARWVPKVTYNLEIKGGYNKTAMPTFIPAGTLTLKVTPNMKYHDAEHATVRVMDENDDVFKAFGYGDVLINDAGDGGYYITLNKPLSGLELNKTYRFKLAYDGNSEFECTQSSIVANMYPHRVGAGKYLPDGTKDAYDNNGNINYANCLSFKTTNEMTWNTVDNYKLWSAENQDFGVYETTYSGLTSAVDGYLVVDAAANHNAKITAEDQTGKGELGFGNDNGVPTLWTGFRIKVSGRGTLWVRGSYKKDESTKRAHLYFSAHTRIYNVGSIEHTVNGVKEKHQTWYDRGGSTMVTYTANGAVPGSETYVESTFQCDNIDLGNTANTTGEFDHPFTFTGTDEETLYVFCDNLAYLNISQIEWIPDPDDLVEWGTWDGTSKTITEHENETRTWDSDTQWSNGHATYKFPINNVNGGGESANEIRIKASSTSQIQVGADGYTIVGNGSANGSGYLEFLAHTPGVVKVYAKGDPDDVTKTLVANPNGQLAAWGNGYTYTIQGNDLNLDNLDDSYTVLIELENNSNDNWASCVTLRRPDWNYFTDDNRERWFMGNEAHGNDHYFQEFSISSQMIDDLKAMETPGIFVTGVNVKIYNIWLVKHNSGLTLSAGTAPRTQWYSIHNDEDEPYTLHFFNPNQNRSVFVGGTPGVTITRIEWTPKTAEAEESELIPVGDYARWYNGNYFGGFGYPLDQDTPIEFSIINPGSGTEAPANTLMIYGNKHAEEQSNPYNYQTRFAIRSGNLSLTRSSSIDANHNDDKSHLVEFKVKTAGVVKIVAAGNGPSGRNMNVLVNRNGKQVLLDYNLNSAETRDELSVMNEGSKSTHTEGNNSQEHPIVFVRNQHSSVHEFYCYYDGEDGETSIFIFGGGGVSINSITWYGQKNIADVITKNADGSGAEMCPENSLSITAPAKSEIIINPEKDTNNYDENAGGRSVHFDTHFDPQGRDVSTYNSTPLWTSSQYGNGSPFNGHISHTENAAGQTHDISVIQKSTSPTGWEYGIVYVVAGTREGNSADWTRVEIAGPSQKVDPIGKTSIIASVGEEITLTAKPWLKFQDWNQEKREVFIKVADPLLSWNAQNAAYISPVENAVQVKAQNEHEDYCSFTFTISEAAAGQTFEVYARSPYYDKVAAAQQPNQMVVYTITVPDPNAVALVRTRPQPGVEYPKNVSVTEYVEFNVIGQNVKEGDELPITLTRKGTQPVLSNGSNSVNELHITGVVTKKGDQMVVTYNLVEAIENATESWGDNQMHHLDYLTDYVFNFDNGANSGINDKLDTDDSHAQNGLNNIIYSFLLQTEPDATNYRKETFIYNVLQRTSAQLDADLVNGTNNNNNENVTYVGRLLSEVTDDNSAWVCNHRSYIYALQGNWTHQDNGNYFVVKKDNDNRKATISLTPYNKDLDNNGIVLDERIVSIEVNCNTATGGTKSIKFKGLTDDGTSTAEEEQIDVNLDNSYTAVWTATSARRRVQIEFDDNICIDQIKVVYYSTKREEKVTRLNFGKVDVKKTAWDARLLTGIDFKNEDGGSRRAKLHFLQRNTRYFALREKYLRSEADDLNRGTITGSRIDAMTTMVIRDDKTEPCTFFIAADGKKACITSIEFIYEVDEGNNLDFRNLFCTSDPRYNPGVQKNMVGWLLDDKALDHGDYTEKRNANDPHTLRKLVYQPESPVNFASFALDPNQEGFIYVREILVRYDAAAESSDAYYIYNTDASSTAMQETDQHRVELYTEGIEIVTPADNRAERYLLKRTSKRNNLSYEIAVWPRTGNQTNGVILDKDDNTTNSSTFQHQKNYTVRLLDKHRMVIRQLAFRTKNNQKPQIYCDFNNNNTLEASECNTELESETTLPALDRNIIIKAPEYSTEAEREKHPTNQQLIVWTYNGDAPSVTFEPDGRRILELGAGCFTACGDETINVTDVISDNEGSFEEYMANNNNSVVIKAVAIPLKGNGHGQCGKLDLINDIGTYGEVSEITRANYIYVPSNAWMTTATRNVTRDAGGDITAVTYTTTFAADDPYSITSASNPGIVDAKGEAVTYFDDKFHGAFSPDNGLKTSMTYGGYELWQKPEAVTRAGGEDEGSFNHGILLNEYWQAKGNDLTPYRGARNMLVGDSYTVSSLEPMNEYAIYTRTDEVNKRGTIALGNRKGEVSSDLYNARVFRGEFNFQQFVEIEDTEAYKRTWELPCYGDYFAFEPTDNGTLTVYVKQEGILDQDNGTLDEELIHSRPVFILDEQGNTPAGIVATTRSSVSGDWMTAKHTNIAPSKYLDAQQSKDLLNMCQQWINNNISDHLNNVEYGDRAYNEQGVLPLYAKNADAAAAAAGKRTSDGNDFNIWGAGTNRASFLGSFDTGMKSDNDANGFMLISEGYVKYEIPVKAGKTYFMFEQRGNLGMCSYSFEPNNVTPVEYTLPSSSTNDISSTLETMRTSGTRYNVKVPRTFKKETWAALVLPFSVGTQQVRKIFGDGVDIIHFTEMTKVNHMELFHHNHQMIVAGVPFFIKPSKDVDQVAMNDGSGKQGTMFENVVISATEVLPIKVGEYVCKGAFTRSEGRDAIYKRNTWYISGGKFSRLTKDLASGKELSINGATPWVEPVTAETAENLGAPAVSFRQFIVDDNEGGQATGIIPAFSDLMPDSSDADAVTFDNNVYDAAGRIIRQNTTDLQGLPAGVYIVNGEKHVINK